MRLFAFKIKFLIRSGSNLLDDTWQTVKTDLKKNEEKACSMISES